MHTNTLLTAPLRLLPAVLAALSLLLAACSDHDEQPQRIVDADRTVLVYMPWTGSTTSSSKSLYNEFLNNIRDIEAAIGQSGGLGKTRLLVFISQWSDRATLIDIWHDGTNCRHDTLKHYTTPTPTTTEAILTVLRDAYRISPTPQYSMIVGSHGSGWMPAGSHPWKARAFGGTEKATQTEIADFAKAIELSPMKKLNYLCFDDCYMANIETAYALRHVTNYFLGSTSEVMSAGLPYRTVWHALSAEPDYASVCSNFLAFYSSYSMPYGTFTAIDCQATEQLAALMRQANATYTLAPADAHEELHHTALPRLTAGRRHRASHRTGGDSHRDNTAALLHLHARRPHLPRRRLVRNNHQRPIDQQSCHRNENRHRMVARHSLMLKILTTPLSILSCKPANQPTQPNTRVFCTAKMLCQQPQADKQDTFCPKVHHRQHLQRFT